MVIRGCVVANMTYDIVRFPPAIPSLEDEEEEVVGWGDHSRSFSLKHAWNICWIWLTTSNSFASGETSWRIGRLIQALGWTLMGVAVVAI